MAKETHNNKAMVKKAEPTATLVLGEIKPADPKKTEKKDIAMITICPVCDEDINLSKRELKIAIRHKEETAGKIFLTCPHCCHVIVPQVEIPEDDALLEEWIAKGEEEEESWLPCLKLPVDIAAWPAGSVDLGGEIKYRPGGGGDLLRKRKYMEVYGINPKCYLAKTNR